MEQDSQLIRIGYGKSLWHPTVAVVQLLIFSCWNVPVSACRFTLNATGYRLKKFNI